MRAFSEVAYHQPALSRITRRGGARQERRLTRKGLKVSFERSTLLRVEPFGGDLNRLKRWVTYHTKGDVDDSNS